MLDVKGKTHPIKKPWCISSCDQRIIEIFSQLQCHKSHEHEPAEGGQTKQTGFDTPGFAQAILESWHPKKAFRRSVMYHACGSSCPHLSPRTFLKANGNPMNQPRLPKRRPKG